jgi:hypothetical protein
MLSAAMLIGAQAMAGVPTAVEQAAIDAVWAAYPWGVSRPAFALIHDPDEVLPGFNASWKDWGNAQSVKPSNPCRGWNGTYDQGQYTVYLLNITSADVAKKVNAECWGLPGGYAVSPADYTPVRLESLTAYELGHVINAAPDLSAGLDAFVAQVMANVAAAAGSHDVPIFIQWPAGLPASDEIKLSGVTWRLVGTDGVKREYQSNDGNASWIVLY